MNADFPLVVDHVSIWVSKRAPEMHVLRDIGLCPKEKINVHTGQGSASQVVLFRNMYLELAWIENEPELAAYLASGGDAAPVRETWKQTGVSPFGVGFHYRTPDAEPLPLGTLVSRSMYTTKLQRKQQLKCCCWLELCYSPSRNPLQQASNNPALLSAWHCLKLLVKSGNPGMANCIRFTWSHATNAGSVVTSISSGFMVIEHLAINCTQTSIGFLDTVDLQKRMLHHWC